MNNILKHPPRFVGSPGTILWLFLLLHGYLLGAQDDPPPIYVRNVCSSETTTVYYDDEEIDWSNGLCKTTKYEAVIHSGEDMISSIGFVEEDPGDHNSMRLQVTINWVSGSTLGMAEIEIRYKVYRGIWCDPGDWITLYTYKLSKVVMSPSGTLSKLHSQYTSRNGKATVTALFTPDNNLGYDVNTIQYYVDGALQATTTGDFTHEINGFGAHTVAVQANDCTGAMVNVASKEITIVPTCHSDAPAAAALSLTNSYDVPDPVLKAQGYELIPGEGYSIRSTGITDFVDHYHLTHDGGSDITLSNRYFVVRPALGSYTINAYPKDDFRRTHCPAIPALRIFVGGHDTVIEHANGCTVTLPDDFPDLGFGHVAPDDPILTHFKATVKSKKGFVIKPGMTLSMGAELDLDYKAPQADTDDPDKHRNYIENTAYDDYGRVVLHSRQYFDDRGQPTQSQTKNLEEDVLLASEVVNDFHGRPVLQTLPAPVRAGTRTTTTDVCGDAVPTGDHVKFQYAENFINGEGNAPYDYKAFDLDPAAGTNREENPQPVADNVPGSLGWYYGSNNGTATGAARPLNEPLVARTAYPYTRTLYHHDGTGRVKSVAGPGEAFRAGSGHVAAADQEKIAEDDPYLADYLAIRHAELGYPPYPATLVKSENFYIETATDAMQHVSKVYKDREGFPLITLYFGTGSTPLTRSYQFYNSAGRLITSLSPNGWEQYHSGTPFGDVDKTTYTYNFRGWLLTTTEPDAGTTNYLYRRDGSLRFSQNTLQQETRSFSYTDYDHLGRPVESGELTGLPADFALRPDLQAHLESPGDGWASSFPGTAKKDWIKTTYDLPDPHFEAETGLSGYRQQFVRGAVSHTRNAHTKTWYSYDEWGRVVRVVQNITGLGTKLIEYRYGPTGDVAEVAYQPGIPGEQFYHLYEYDKNARLSQVYTATEPPQYDRYGAITNRSILRPQALYDYYLHGPLKRIELADQLQGIDFVYTVSGALKAINDADPARDPGHDGTNGFPADAFGMTLDYYDGDHQRGTVVATAADRMQYTGNIKAQSWHSPVDGGQQKAYLYTYDDRHQLSAADFGSLAAGAFVPGTGAFDMTIPVPYDPNGNLKALARNNGLATARHDMTYNYRPNTNQLQGVTHGGAAFRSYTYNSIGQMTAQVDNVAGESQLVDYDVTGKVTAIYTQQGSDATTKRLAVRYLYDDRGFRLAKQTYEADGTTLKARTWYVRDAAGALLRAYNTDPTLDEYPIYGTGRLGVYRPHGWSPYLYELSDHLGNVRAVLTEDQRALTWHVDYEAGNPDLAALEKTENIHAFPGYNRTPGGARSQRLSSGAGSPYRVGSVLAFPVDAGDKISAEVYARYTAPGGTASPVGAIGQLVFGAVSGWAGNAAVEGAINHSYGPSGSMITSGLYPGDYDSSDPAAFLNLLFVPDEVGTTIETGHFAFDQLSTAAAGSHEKLRIANFTVEKSGVVVIYLSNESVDFKEVYFDDLVVEVTQPNILHATDYYPFGLAIRERSLEREKYRFQYQGQFAEYDEETGRNAFELRRYDPVVGRWTSTDPYRQYWSSYVGMGNNPVNGVDPDGGKFQDIIRRVNGVEVERIKTDDNFDIVINEFTFPQGSPFADGTTIGIYDKIFFSADQLSAVEFQLQYDKYFSKATGAIDFDPGGQLLVGELAGMAVKAIGALGSSTAAKSSTQGGLNLFKWGAPQTGKNVGWKTGDYMLHLPNKGTPKLNWKANYGALRREMGLGKPIFDSYRTTGGNLIPTKGFLNAERSILQGRGWIYNPSKGAWMPPGF